MTTQHHPVTNGPAKWDLSVALFDRKHVNCRKVTFTVTKEQQPEVEVDVHVNSVQAEDGSGESWNIEGYATQLRNKNGGAIAHIKVPAPSERVFIYFRTDNRTGYIKFLK